MRTLLCLLLAMPVVVEAQDAPPNRQAVVERLAQAHPDAFRCAHTSAACGWDFIRLLACELRKEDIRWGLNGKRGNPNDLSWDALNWKGFGPARDPATGDPVTVIDVIVGAGAPGARPAWIVFSTDMTPGAWVQPDCGGAVPPPVPTPPPVDPEIGARLARLEQAIAGMADLLMRLAPQIDRAAAEALNAAERANEIKTALAALEARPVVVEWPEYSGRVLGFGVTLRPSSR